jgi:glycosyltransferase involved in cell wall biosynthesis
MSTPADITVVVPCYEAAAYLPETLACLPAGVRVIVVDDASTDGTAVLLQAWQADDASNRSVLKHAVNQGLGATRNTGWRAANSEWILFLDADDVLEDGWHSALGQALSQQPAERCWLWHPYTEWDGQRKRLRQTDQLLQAADLVTKRLPLAPSGSLIRRSVLEEIGGWSESRDLVEDIDLWMRLWQAGHRPEQWSTTPWTRYRTNVGLTKDVEAHAAKVLGRLDEFVTRGWIQASERQGAEAEIWRQVGRTHHKARRWTQARAAYGRAKPSLKTALLRGLTYLHLPL